MPEQKCSELIVFLKIGRRSFCQQIIYFSTFVSKSNFVLVQDGESSVELPGPAGGQRERSVDKVGGLGGENHCQW